MENVKKNSSVEIPGMSPENERNSSAKYLDEETSVSVLKLQLENEKLRCKNLEDQVAGHVRDNLMMKKKVVEVDAKYSETCRKLEEVEKQKQILLEKKCDLEITIAESDVHNLVMQENLNELEDICTTLREQREMQNSYFMQRELSLKADFDNQVQKVKDEKFSVMKNLQDLKSDYIKLNDELHHVQFTKERWNTEKERLQLEVENLESKVKRLENELSVEKETVDMFSKKNEELAADVLSSRSESMQSSPRSRLSEDAAAKIELLVNEFFEKKSQSVAQFNETRVEKLLKELHESEIRLREEQRLRQDAIDRLRATEEEFRKTKNRTDALIASSVARCRTTINRTDAAAKSKYNTSAFLQDIANTHEFNHMKPLFESNNIPSFETTSLCNPKSVPESDTAINQSNLVDQSAVTTVSKKSAEKIKEANEKALEKLKQVSFP